MPRIVLGTHNLTEEFLQEAERRVRADDASDLRVRYIIAFEIIANSLGLEFFKKQWWTPGTAQPFFAEKPDVRMFHLADKIWATRGLVGFESMLERARRGDFQSAYYEIFTASWFLSRAQSVEYNTPTGVKGSDFDLKVHHGLGFEELNVEVKSRKEVFTSKKQVESYVSKARSQVPRGIPAALVINPKLSEKSIPQEELDDVLAKCVRESSTWRFILYFWDDSKDSKAIVLVQACVNENGRCDQWTQRP